MSFLRNAAEAAKSMPKTAWLAAVVIPGGFAVVGLWLIYKAQKEKKK